MFVNYTKKFVFVGVTKTGSTSIQSSLVNLKGDDDVAYTGVDIGTVGWKSFNMPDGCEIPSHPSLNDALRLNLLTKDQIEKFSVFGVVRNPIDRFISLSYFMLHGLGAENWSHNIVVKEWFERRHNYVDTIDPLLYAPQTHWLTFNGKRIDNIIPYESINKIVHQMVGLDTPLATFRSGFRLDRKNYDSLYNHLKQKIIEEYSEDYRLYMDVVSENT